MTVTKQQQLEFAAKHIEKWKSGYDYAVVEETTDGHLYVRWPSICTSGITKKEWQQERDKMQNEKSVITGGIYLTRSGFRFEVVDIAKAGSDCSIDMVVYVNLDATNDFPPGQKWVLELESFISKFKLDSSRKPAPDNSWHERGKLPPVGCECSAVRDGQWVTVEVLRHRVNNVGMNVAAVMSCASFNIFWATDFRPLCPEREKAIDEMANLIAKSVFGSAKCQAEKLYDAGYLKINP